MNRISSRQQVIEWLTDERNALDEAIELLKGDNYETKPRDRQVEKAIRDAQLTRKRAPMSDEARAAISVAQKARWAKYHATQDEADKITPNRRVTTGQMRRRFKKLDREGLAELRKIKAEGLKEKIAEEEKVEDDGSSPWREKK